METTTLVGILVGLGVVYESLDYIAARASRKVYDSIKSDTPILAQFKKEIYNKGMVLRSKGDWMMPGPFAYFARRSLDRLIKYVP